MNTKELNEFFYNGAAIVGQIKEEVQHTDTVKELKRLIAEKEVFVVKITGMRPEDDVVTAKVLDGYMGLIPKAQVSSRMYIRNKMSDLLIGQNVPVIVERFNETDKTVALSRVHAIKELSKNFLNEILPVLDEINENGVNYKQYTSKFEEGNDPYFDKYPRVKAKVIDYDKKGKRVLVNIAGLDLIGTMDISKFDYKYIYNPEKFLEEYMKPNRVIEVALLMYYDNSGQGKPSNFVVSRRHALTNPWTGIEKKIRKDDIIVVTALEKKDSHFFGAYDNFPLDIKCYYPEIPDKQIMDDEKYGRRLVTPGKEYKVKVEKVNPTTKLLTASFLGEL